MLEPVRHPMLVRVADAAHARLEDLDAPLVALDPEALIRRARRNTGLHDLGSPAFREGLDALCGSAQQDGLLNLPGRLLLSGSIVNALQQRLRRVELRTRPLDLFERPLNRPVIVLGLPRAGTTFLHRLLAGLSEARPLRSWEVRMPLRGPGRDRRRDEVAGLLRMVKRAAPALDAKHFVDADMPEECILLLDETMVSTTWWMFFPVYSYLDWLKTADHRGPYQVYRQYLQVFQAGSPDRRLVLKCPAHAPQLDALLEAVPEAIVVQCHRDPTTVLASVNSLFHTIHGICSRRLDHDRLGQANLDLLGWTMDRNLEQRRRLADGRVFDVHYRDLTADPIGTVEQICAHTGLDFSASAVQAGLDARPQHRHGTHTYTLEEHGLSEAQVRKRFAAYTEHFGV